MSEISVRDTFDLPSIFSDSEPVWHIFALQVLDRDRLIRSLRNSGIASSINYPVALPFLEAYARFGYSPEDFPNAYRVQNSTLSIPLYPEMSDDQAGKFISVLNSC